MLKMTFGWPHWVTGITILETQMFFVEFAGLKINVFVIDFDTQIVLKCMWPTV